MEKKRLILLFVILFVGCTSSAPVTSSPEPTETPLATLLLDNGHEMVLVQAGSFQMGFDIDEGLAICQQLFEPFSDGSCSKEAYVGVGPVHNIYLNDFYIDVYEVTNAQYARCVKEGKCSLPTETGSATRDSYYDNSQFENFPVIFVSWENANDYCQWRDDARLPTEAEWEKAARGTDNLTYPWGNSFDGNLLNFCDSSCLLDHANTNYDDSFSDTAPVGSFPKGVSPYGVHDMAGNVWEWVADWYDAEYYRAAVQADDNPVGPESGEFRVLRGGSWDGAGYTAHSAYRGFRPPSSSSSDFGFRCVRSSG